MGDVLVMPGVDPTLIRPRPRSIEELRRGEQALVVEPRGPGFAIMLRPQLVVADSEPRGRFMRLRDALIVARRMSACEPRRFPLVLNEAPHPAWSLNETMGFDPDPMGFGGDAA